MGMRSPESMSILSVKLISSPKVACPGRLIIFTVIACTGPDISSIAIMENVIIGLIYGLIVCGIFTPDKLLIRSVLHLNDKTL